MKGFGGRLALLLLLLNVAVLGTGIGLEHYRQTGNMLVGYNADKITLLRSPAGERPGMDGSGGHASEPEPVPVGKDAAGETASHAAATPAGDCLVVRDYSQASHDRLLADLAAAGLKPGQYAIRLDKPLGWWVYIPPEGNEARREALIAVLKAAGVRDMAVIGRGSMTNAISLGMFAESGQAAAHLAAMQAKGVSGVVYGPRPGMGAARVDLTGMPAQARERLPARLRGGLAACG